MQLEWVVKKSILQGAGRMTVEAVTEAPAAIESPDELRLRMHKHAELVELLGQMIGKFMRDTPGAGSLEISAYARATAREIGLEREDRKSVEQWGSGRGW